MSEVWKDVVGYEGHYMVSNTGSVKSVRRPYRGGGRWIAERILRPAISRRTGYKQVALHRDGRSSTKNVHQLVLEAFVGPRPVGCDSCHNDGNRLNNAVENLRWDTHVENMRDRIDHGTAMRGHHHPMAKLCPLDVWLIREIEAKHAVLAEFFGVSRSNIGAIKSGKSWGHL